MRFVGYGTGLVGKALLGDVGIISCRLVSCYRSNGSVFLSLTEAKFLRFPAIPSKVQ